MSKQDTWEINALVVHQWLDEWNQVHFSEQEHRLKPQPTFYLFKLPALLLWRLSDIYRRRADRPRSQDTATQRAHSRERSAEIGRFVQGGFPWSDLSESQKTLADYQICGCLVGSRRQLWQTSFCQVVYGRVPPSMTGRSFMLSQLQRQSGQTDPAPRGNESELEAASSSSGDNRWAASPAGI